MIAEAHILEECTRVICQQLVACKESEMTKVVGQTDDGGYASQLLEGLNTTSDEESPSAMDLVGAQD